MAVKGGTRVSVVIPARDEEATVGAIVAAIRHCLIEQVPLVDELIVVDSRSRDGTAAAAAAAGATVAAQEEVLEHLPPLDGKGEALWKGLAASSGDIVTFIDADLLGFTPDFVTGLLGPPGGRRLSRTRGRDELDRQTVDQCRPNGTTSSC